MNNKKRILALSLLLLFMSLTAVFAKTQLNNNGGQTLASDMPPIISACEENILTFASDAPPIISP
jgi:hypothetical protein